ncbi:flagellar export chaperone FlgN [Aporhodopirellula aestuarii]|uniref:Flagellar protein FlgN n=1 Tax=Aporhodopirellula aestuarii TaxID=2950107 RepID=A0ABT0U4E6_9BACT|nr:flagellar export chaperone FlgN [Aporhodopirellula aestuarii]MCM2371772.1 flagellar protein FlgN [Aporhodopirellula aestuarii]
MPTIAELEQTIETRHQQLTQLLDLTTQQEASIEEGHMNELMRLLGVKQRLIEQFVKLSNQLKEDYDGFATKPQVSDAHRELNAACNTMHQQLLAREAKCQEALTANRDELGETLARGEGARRAAAGYGRVGNMPRPQGGGLDLSSDA